MNSDLNYEIKYLNSDVDKEIIQKYWKIDSSKIKWKYNIDEVAKMKGFKMRQLSNYIKNNSELFLKCAECNKLIGVYTQKSQIQMIEFVEKEGFICNQCYEKSNKTKIIKEYIVKEVEPKYSKEDKLNFAFKTKQWKDLNQTELEVLIKIAESTSKNEMYSKIFPNGNINNKFYWSILKRLENQNLIWVDREGKKVIYIHKHGDLYKQLLKEYPHLIIERNDIIPPKKYSFTLEKFDKKKENQPNFTGKIKLSSNIELKKNTVYDCSAWINKKDNLYIRINEE